MNNIPRLLDSSLPEFRRTSWVSERARKVWESRISAVMSAWAMVEEQSVAHGIRRVALVAAFPETLSEKETRWRRMGLTAKVLTEARITSGYSSSLQPPVPGERSSLRVAIGQTDAVGEMAQAYAQNDVHSIGRALGYPECCCAFFKSTWCEAKLRDSTWPMAVGTLEGHWIDESTLQISGSAYCNILWRWMGVRAVPHLPCSFRCAATSAYGKSLVELGAATGYKEEMASLKEMLSWPIEWSALHGIAEIKTPILKLMTSTDATPVRYRVRLSGTGFPAEGATGLNFPFLEPGNSKRPLHNNVPPESDQQGTFFNGDSRAPARFNGFRTRELMDRAHAPLVRAVTDALGDVTGGRVLDLGCGDGTLLRKIVAKLGTIIPFGIDIRNSEIAQAQTLTPNHEKNFVVGNLKRTPELWARRYDIALLAIQRLEELSSHSDVTDLLSKMRASAQKLLLYQYGHSSAPEESFVLRAARLSLRFVQPPVETHMVTYGFLGKPGRTEID